MIRVIPFHYETAQKHPERIRKVSDLSIRYVACGLDSYNGRFYFERENSIVDVCHVLNMNSRTWNLIEEIPDAPKPQKTKTVPKTIDDLPRRPFWRNCMNIGKDITNCVGLDEKTLVLYANRGDTYSETLDGPWLPFTKEVACD